MEKNISTFLFFNLLKTFVISSLLDFITLQVKYIDLYRTLEQKQGDFIEVIAEIFWLFALTISATTVYFNLLKLIRNTPILCFISFYLMPFIFIILVLCLEKQNSELSSFYISSLIFLLIHTLFYIIFLVWLKKDRLK